MLLIHAERISAIQSRHPAEQIITKIKSLLSLGTEGVHIFRHCGKEATQDLGTFSIEIICRATSERLTKFKLPTGRFKNLAAEASPEEKEWLSTSVGILAQSLVHADRLSVTTY